MAASKTMQLMVSEGVVFKPATEPFSFFSYTSMKIGTYQRRELNHPHKNPFIHCLTLGSCDIAGLCDLVHGH